LTAEEQPRWQQTRRKKKRVWALFW